MIKDYINIKSVFWKVILIELITKQNRANYYSWDFETINFKIIQDLI